MYKIGVIGCGAVAAFGHLPAIAETPELEVSALFDPDAERVNQLGVQYPYAWRFTNEDAFYKAEMDAVVIASPAPAHFANLKLAAEHGKHVLCEKPLALRDEDAVAMIELMRSRELMLFTGFCYRFSPVALQIQQLIASGAIGEVRVIRLVYLWGLDGKYLYTGGEKAPNARRNARMLEGGPMVDCGVHLIDLARWWLQSEPVTVSGFGGWVEEFEAPDHVTLQMQHACGAVSLIETSFSYAATAKDPASVFTYEIIGADGLIRYDRDGWKLEMRNSGGTYHYAGASEKNFHGMYSDFAAALHYGTSGSLASGLDGLKASRIACEATNQAISRRAGLAGKQVRKECV